MDRFVEFARAGSHRRGRLIRSSDYPKTGYILTLLPHSPATRWTCRAKEANCRLGQFGGLLWKTSKIWRLRSRQSALWALRRQVGSQFIHHMLSPRMFPRLRQRGVGGRIRRLNRPRSDTSNSVKWKVGYQCVGAGDNPFWTSLG